MLQYKLDDLEWSGFEQLIQTLLKVRLGLGVEAWGGHGDWGRDAYFEGALKYPTKSKTGGPFVFQCKFVEGANAAGAKPENAILAALRKESNRIRRNLTPGGRWAKRPRCYALFTNASLTPSLRKKATQMLSTVLLRCKVRIHDGHDVCGWLNLSREVALSFPQIAQHGSLENIRAKLRQAHDLEFRFKTRQAAELYREAFSMAEEARALTESVEALLSLAGIALNRHEVGDGEQYLKNAEKRLAKVLDLRLQAVFHRQKGFLLECQGKLKEAETSYRRVLEIAADGDKKLQEEAFWTSTALVHLYCQAGQLDEAEQMLSTCASRLPDSGREAGRELLKLYHEAAIHLAICRGHLEKVREHVAKVTEKAVSTASLERAGGMLQNIANQARRLKAFDAGILCSEVAAQLGHRAKRPDLAIAGNYTTAALHFDRGDLDEAKRICLSLLDTARGAKESKLLYAVAQLLSVVARRQGDAKNAVHFAEIALSAAEDDVHAACMGKIALADALFDAGRVEEALKHAREANDLAKSAKAPPPALIEALGIAVDAASLLGEWNTVDKLTEDLKQIPEGRKEDEDRRSQLLKRIEANRELRRRLEIVAKDNQPLKTAATEGCRSVQEANAVVFRPLLEWWKEIPEAVAASYDLWGRGNLTRILLNLKAFPHTFNTTVEVRSLDEVRQAVRLWSLFTDVLVLVWKGPMRSGVGLVPFPGDYSGPGGWGYMVCAGSRLNKAPTHKQDWFPALAYGSILPEEIGTFLATESVSLVELGRLLLVPASAVGCVHPDHGPLESLFAEICNATPCTKDSSLPQSPIGLLPYFPDAPIPALANIIGEHQATLHRLRLLLMRRTRELRSHSDLGPATKEIELEIQDALANLRELEGSLSRKHGWLREDERFASGQLRFTEQQFVRAAAEARGSHPLFSLSEVLGDRGKDVWSPVLFLENLGYGWRVEAPRMAATKPRYEPDAGEAVGAWLCPPSPGWSIPTAREFVPLGRGTSSSEGEP